ncbi:MAG: dihydrolipoamide acetyltransferase family protein [Clostridia bacterium]|nr:dihydrolipoamide acetyltransferase family protein [Clostridia bacterium]
MATKVILPKQGLQMTEGTITKWIRHEGETVELDKPLFEMETDKLTIEIDAPAAGTLLKIIKGEGEVVPITEMIAVIGTPGEDISSLLADSGDAANNTSASAPAASAVPVAQAADAATEAPKAAKAPGGRVFATPRAKMVAQDKGLDVSTMEGSGPDGLVIERDVLQYAASAPKATPLAAKIAQQNGVDLGDVAGTGARGKIMKGDVLSAMQPAMAGASQRVGKVVPFAGMRKVISNRMMKSLHETAQANHRMKVDMTEVIALREKLKSDGEKVSFNDILIKIAAKALLEFPMVNASLRDEGILMQDYVNMGIAVAVENGLIVPVVRDVDLMTLGQLSEASAAQIEKAKTGKLAPNDYTGGTFTITNLGMFDVDEFTAIINPPESAILAVGKIAKTPVVIGDSIVIRPIMTLSLTYDHRLIDGSVAAQFLQRVKQIISDPYLLL